jgi:hypothetical protein
VWLRNKLHGLAPRSQRQAERLLSSYATTPLPLHELLFAYKCVALRQGLHDQCPTFDLSTHLVRRFTRAEYLLRLHDRAVRCGDHVC